jgi:hypothetical protein
VLRILTFWGSLFAIGSGLTLVRDIAGFWFWLISSVENNNNRFRRRRVKSQT